MGGGGAGRATMGGGGGGSLRRAAAAAVDKGLRGGREGVGGVSQAGDLDRTR